MIIGKPLKETQIRTKKKTIRPERIRKVDGVDIVTPCIIEDVESQVNVWVIETEINGEIERHEFRTKKPATSYSRGFK